MNAAAIAFAAVSAALVFWLIRDRRRHPAKPKQFSGPVIPGGDHHFEHPESGPQAVADSTSAGTVVPDSSTAHIERQPSEAHPIWLLGITAFESLVERVREKPVERESAALDYQNKVEAGWQVSISVASEPGATAPEPVTPRTDIPNTLESPEPNISARDAALTRSAGESITSELALRVCEGEEDAVQQISTGAAPEPKSSSPRRDMPGVDATEALAEQQSEAASAINSRGSALVSLSAASDDIDIGQFVAEERQDATGYRLKGTQQEEAAATNELTEFPAPQGEASPSVITGVEERPVVTSPLSAGENVQSPVALANDAGDLRVAPEQVLPLIEMALEEHPKKNEVEAQATGGTAVPLYRPISPRPPRVGRSVTGKPENGERSPARELALDIRVHVTLSRFGIRDITFLPVRSSQIEDSEIRVRSAVEDLTLVAQEDWYQDLHLEDTGRYLLGGIELRGTAVDGRPIRWLLSGRTLYVLATHPRTSAYVSTNRLMIGRPHVILCTADSFAAVKQMLCRAGCEGFSQLDEGVPEGWVALRDVTPKQAVLDDLGDNLLNAVKPTPNIDIHFEGGVCLRNQEWLAGYPPEIRVLGPADQIKLLIDDKEAEVRDGRLYAEGYDLPGAHTVYCEGLPHSRTYSIVEPAEDWTEWPAYHFRDAEICGPLVRITGNATKPIIVPMTNPLLIGAEGQIFRCSARNSGRWKGYLPFDVVWALPAQPLTCNKKTSRIIQLGRAPVGTAASRSRTALSWSNAILNASRKGLQLDGGSAEGGVLWRDYKKAARAIRKAAR